MAKKRGEMTEEFRKRYVTKIQKAEAILYKGLVAMAHEDPRFGGIVSTITQYPNAENKFTCFCEAKIVGADGVTVLGQDIGDANTQNCGKMVAASFPRMASTRAKARALRDFLNVDLVCAEEIGDVYEPEKADPKTIGKIKRYIKAGHIEKEALYKKMRKITGAEEFNEMSQEDADLLLADLVERYGEVKKKADGEDAA